MHLQLACEAWQLCFLSQELHLNDGAALTVPQTREFQLSVKSCWMFNANTQVCLCAPHSFTRPVRSQLRANSCTTASCFSAGAPVYPPAQVWCFWVSLARGQVCLEDVPPLCQRSGHSRLLPLPKRGTGLEAASPRNSVTEPMSLGPDSSYTGKQVSSLHTV